MILAISWISGHTAFKCGAILGALVAMVTTGFYLHKHDDMILAVGTLPAFAPILAILVALAPGVRDNVSDHWAVELSGGYLYGFALGLFPLGLYIHAGHR